MSTNYSIPTPIIPFAPPVYAARFNPKPFTLDGRLGKEFWADIPMENADTWKNSLRSDCKSVNTKGFERRILIKP